MERGYIPSSSFSLTGLARYTMKHGEKYLVKILKCRNPIQTNITTKIETLVELLETVRCGLVRLG